METQPRHATIPLSVNLQRPAAFPFDKPASSRVSTAAPLESGAAEEEIWLGIGATSLLSRSGRLRLGAGAAERARMAFAARKLARADCTAGGGSGDRRPVLAAGSAPRYGAGRRYHHAGLGGGRGGAAGSPDRPLVSALERSALHADALRTRLLRGGDGAERDYRDPFRAPCDRRPPLHAAVLFGRDRAGRRLLPAAGSGIRMGGAGGGAGGVGSRVRALESDHAPRHDGAAGQFGRRLGRKRAAQWGGRAQARDRREPVAGRRRAQQAIVYRRASGNRDMARRAARVGAPGAHRERSAGDDSGGAGRAGGARRSRRSQPAGAARRAARRGHGHWHRPSFARRLRAAYFAAGAGRGRPGGGLASERPGAAGAAAGALRDAGVAAGHWHAARQQRRR